MMCEILLIVNAEKESHFNNYFTKKTIDKFLKGASLASFGFLICTFNRYIIRKKTSYVPYFKVPKVYA